MAVFILVFYSVPTGKWWQFALIPVDDFFCNFVSLYKYLVLSQAYRECYSLAWAAYLWVA